MMTTNEAKPNFSTCSTRPAGTDAPTRRPYEAPTLIPYGSLSELTQAFGSDPTDGTLGTSTTN